MEITPAILQRYNSGTATDAEVEAVETWLTSTDTEAYSLDPVDLAEMKTAVWDNLLEQAIDEQRNIRSIHASRYKVIYLPLAAAMLVLLIGIVVFQKLNWTTSNGSVSEGVLITSAQGPIEVLEDNFKVQFTGYLQVVNRSNQYKSIECTNGEQYTLDPGETYYLETIDGRHYLIAERYLSPEDNYLRFVKGDVEVFTKTI